MKEESPRFKARLAAFFYVLVFVMGGLGFYVGGKFLEVRDPAAAHETAFRQGSVFTLIAINKGVSLTAAFFSLIGCALGAVNLGFQAAAPLILKDAHYSRLSLQVSNIGFVFFGVYCFLIGCLIFGSNFLPRPPLVNYLAPYNFIPGMLGEASLTLWLLVMGVNAERWKQQLIPVPEH